MDHKKFLSEIGRKGGKKTALQRDAEFYAAMGKKSGESRRNKKTSEVKDAPVV